MAIVLYHIPIYGLKHHQYKKRISLQQVTIKQQDLKCYATDGLVKGKNTSTSTFTRSITTPAVKLSSAEYSDSNKTL